MQWLAGTFPRAIDFAAAMTRPRQFQGALSTFLRTHVFVELMKADLEVMKAKKALLRDKRHIEIVLTDLLDGRAVDVVQGVDGVVHFFSDGEKLIMRGNEAPYRLIQTLIDQVERGEIDPATEVGFDRIIHGIENAIEQPEVFPLSRPAMPVGRQEVRAAGRIRQTAITMAPWVLAGLLATATAFKVSGQNVLVGGAQPAEPETPPVILPTWDLSNL